MAENFDLIFGQNASQQYAWNDTDYENGWETIGNIPPTAAQFDALQRRSDTKMKELNDGLTPLVNADTADSRQPSTAYSVGVIKYTPLLPTGWYLECTVAGTTSSGDITLPTQITENITVTDGTVTWKVRKPANTANIPSLSGYATTNYVQSYVQSNSAKPNSWLPNLTRGIALAAGTTYTPSENGWLFTINYHSTSAQKQTVNGYTVVYVQSNTGSQYSSSWVPVAKGSSIVLATTSDSKTSRVFYPCLS